MRILVTGGAGFLGSNLCYKLLELNYEVICLDNLYTGLIRNIEPLKTNPKFTFIEHDIINPINLKVDQIYNFACPASPVHYQSDPIYTLNTCYLGALNMLDLAKANNATILQASTSEVYGDPLVHPQAETYRGNVNPIGIRSCYDEGKRVAETLFFDYYRKYSSKIKVVRIFNTYGPNMRPDDGRVVSNFIVQALNHQDLTVYGDGSQTRSFCYVDDLLDGIYQLMNSSNEVQGPINMGNPTEFTVLQLAHKVIEMTGSTSQIIYKDLPHDDPVQRKPVIQLAEKYLKWYPKIDLSAGLTKTIEYFKTNKA
jgi:UDP-glucuronate decarboxylase